MAQQTINIGASPNDGTGTPLRTAFQYTNSNFSELYTAVGPSGNNIVVPGNATITGDLTVDTSTLKVDSTNNRVGIGTATPSQVLSIQGPANQAFLIADDSTATYRAIYGVDSVAGGGVLGCISNHPVIFRVNNTEQMRLNSTGLGVGDSPSYKLHVARTADGTVGYFRRIGATINPALTVYCNETGNTVGFGTDYAGSVSPAITFTTAGAERLRIDASGNCGIGVTPSAWLSGYKALQINATTNLFGTGTASWLTNNWTVNAAGSNTYQLGSATAATAYFQGSGSHYWFNAVAGTGTISAPVQAMTLDASGRLILLASTTTPATLSTNGQLTFTATSDTNLRFSYRGSDGVTRVANLTLA